MPWKKEKKVSPMIGKESNQLGLTRQGTEDGGGPRQQVDFTRKRHEKQGVFRLSGPILRVKYGF